MFGLFCVTVDELVCQSEALRKKEPKEVQASQLRKYIPKMKKLIYLSIEEIEGKGKGMWTDS